MKLTWVTSAEVTHITTTVAIKNKPALYLQPIKNQTRPTPDAEKPQRFQRSNCFDQIFKQVLLAFDLPPTPKRKIQDGVDFNVEASEKEREGIEGRLVSSQYVGEKERILANKNQKSY